MQMEGPVGPGKPQLTLLYEEHFEGALHADGTMTLAGEIEVWHGILAASELQHLVLCPTRHSSTWMPSMTTTTSARHVKQAASEGLAATAQASRPRQAVSNALWCP